MAQLFEGGESAVYKCIRSWLHVDRPLKLQTAGVFAMCNIARSGDKLICCLIIVKVYLDFRINLISVIVKDMNNISLY